MGRADEQIVHEFDLVQRWITKGHPDVHLDKPQRQAGWPWLVRQAGAWLERLQRELRDETDWASWMPTQSLGPWTLVPIRGPLQLWEEARAMHHCVEMFEAACRSGDTLIVSVRQGDRRIATAELVRRQREWHLGQIKGFANREAPEKLMEALAGWVAGIGRACEGSGQDDEIHDKTACLVIDVGDDDDDGDDSSLDADAKLIDEVVAAVIDGNGADEDGAILTRLAAWLERRNDEGNLSYEYGGRIVLRHQFDNWTADPVTWLESARDAGVIGDTRCAELLAADEPAAAMTAPEIDAVRETFVRQILEADDPDGDVYGIWGAERLQASDGRSAWAVYRISGYSFTIVEVSLLGICRRSEEVAGMLQDFGRFAGSLPAPGSGLAG